MNKNVHTFLGCDATYDEADIVLFGAPFDATTSFRPGTRFASSVMRNESYGMETYSPYQDVDMQELAIFDSGDIEIPFGNVEKALRMIKERTAMILADDKRPCMIGGEHLVSLGAFQAIHERYPDVIVLHFDAHCDLRDHYLDERMSHACVLRRIWNIVGDHRIYQFGIRSGEQSEFAFAKQHTHMYPFHLHDLENIVKTIQDKPIYITLDLDVLDPSIFPGTGTPEAGGVSFQELQVAIMKLYGLHIVGMDITELAPNYDPSGVSTAVANKVLRELLIASRRKKDE